MKLSGSNLMGAAMVLLLTGALPGSAQLLSFDTCSAFGGGYACYAENFGAVGSYIVTPGDEALDPLGNDRWTIYLTNYSMQYDLWNWWTSSADSSLTIQIPNGKLEEYIATADDTGFDCLCGITTAWNDYWTLVTVIVRTPWLLMQSWVAASSHNTPVRGTPNSWSEFPSKNGKVVRVYGSDGKADYDLDYGDQAHSQWNPEKNKWDWSSCTPKRLPPVQPQPGDFPAGVPTTWP